MDGFIQEINSMWMLMAIFGLYHSPEWFVHTWSDFCSSFRYADRAKVSFLAHGAVVWYSYRAYSHWKGARGLRTPFQSGITIQNNHLLIGNSLSRLFVKITPLHVSSLTRISIQVHTRLKILGDGAFGTVSLCDWHGILPPSTPLSPM